MHTLIDFEALTVVLPLQPFAGRHSGSDVHGRAILLKKKKLKECGT
jgi:hypothetical protein